MKTNDEGQKKNFGMVFSRKILSKKLQDTVLGDTMNCNKVLSKLLGMRVQHGRVPSQIRDNDVIIITKKWNKNWFNLNKTKLWQRI